ncbi:MAG: VOC family protein [Gemmatimonadetes bacterium]|nr:VOC family protein [Gemmatimonadota bacterium]
MANAINWFEIPANNFERAVTFYSTVLDCEMQRMDLDGFRMAIFPHGEGGGGGVGGAVCSHDEFYTPSAEGTLVYLNGGDDLSVPLSRVAAAGGTVLMDKKKISDEHGYMAVFKDSEGNRVALHSMA